MTAEQYVRSTDVEDRASFQRKCLWRIEAFAWDWLYWWPISRLSPARASDVGGWIGRRLGPLLKQHKVALANLRAAFPDWDEAQIRATASQAWESAGRTAGELPHLSKLKPYEAGSAVDVVGAERLDDIEKSATGAVLVSGHFANWEIMASAICNRPLDCLVTYRAINNPHIDRRLNTVRHDYGIAVLAPKGLGTRTLMRALQDGRSVALMNDQKFREGLAVPFFGRPAMTAPGPSRLALRYGVPIIPVSTVRTGPARFRVTIHPPIHPEKTGSEGEQVLATVKAITGFIENEVRANPGQWFWMHRRWPKPSELESLHKSAN
ncbi:MAG: lysophospholipid acyltransferase family protein [Pseudomonadota bacterium]